MNPHDKKEDHKNNQNINELSSEHADEQDNFDDENQDDLILDDEDEPFNLDEEDQDDEPYDLEDDRDEPYEDEEGDADDEENDEGDNTPAPARPQGRGLRSLPVVEEEELPPSKTKIKKQMHDLRDLGEELTELGKDQLNQLDIPESLRDALREMHKMKSHGAIRRQIQYIGKLMRDVDTAPIIAKLNTWKGTSQQHIGYMHQLERWRERLMESDSALTELLAAYPEIDVQHLRTLIRNSHKEKEAGKPAKNFREIFQVLRETIPEPT
jgi:ribosome-associated protein